MDFHTVKTCTLGAFGRRGKPLDHLRDIILIHHADLYAAFAVAYGADETGHLLGGERLHHVAFAGRWHRGHPQRSAFGHVTHRVLAGVLQLHGDFGAMLVHPFGQAGETWNELIGRHPDLKRLGRTGRKGDGAHAHDQQASATGGTCFVISLDAFTAVAIGFGKIGAHGRHDDAVA
ncbi:hypothetical protein D3C85_843490 [compost metagenome]